MLKKALTVTALLPSTGLKVQATAVPLKTTVLTILNQYKVLITTESNK
jgi:hypothetical protein